MAQRECSQRGEEALPGLQIGRLSGRRKRPSDKYIGEMFWIGAILSLGLTVPGGIFKALNSL
jgi:hypothetical protein